jgi:hypothetical protein
MSAAELFSQLFPDGVQMTGELFADLEQWIRLTGKARRRRQRNDTVRHRLSQAASTPSGPWFWHDRPAGQS